jgi:NitT/TauT family transport system ATP-binding protein
MREQSARSAVSEDGGGEREAVPISAQRLIQVQEVSKRFPIRGGFTEALLNVSFDIGRNEFISLIGPSGCGKTTILKLIGDILPASSGRILIDGKTPSQARKERSFGFVFQDPVLLPWRTVEQNVRLFHEVIGDGNRPAVRQHVRDLIELVRLQGFEQHYPGELSGGMQQRVSIARALSFDPQILLMDEPFGALDMITRDKMGFELLSIWERARKTVLLVTHSITEAVFLSDRVVVFSPRPAQVLRIVDVTLPRPRPPEIRDEPVFHEYTRELRRLLE